MRLGRFFVTHVLSLTLLLCINCLEAVNIKSSLSWMRLLSQGCVKMMKYIKLKNTGEGF